MLGTNTTIVNRLRLLLNIGPESCTCEGRIVVGMKVRQADTMLASKFLKKLLGTQSFNCVKRQLMVGEHKASGMVDIKGASAVAKGAFSATGVGQATSGSRDIMVKGDYLARLEGA
jgi:hypothetical protein